MIRPRCYRSAPPTWARRSNVLPFRSPLSPVANRNSLGESERQANGIERDVIDQFRTACAFMLHQNIRLLCSKQQGIIGFGGARFANKIQQQYTPTVILTCYPCMLSFPTVPRGWHDHVLSPLPGPPKDSLATSPQRPGDLIFNGWNYWGIGMTQLEQVVKLTTIARYEQDSNLNMALMILVLSHGEHDRNKFQPQNGWQG